MTLTMRPEDWTHPALTELPWEHTEADRIGVHGVALRAQGRRVDYGPVYRSVDCYCGWTSGDCATDRDAFDALVAHAVQQASPDRTACPSWCDGTHPSHVHRGVVGQVLIGDVTIEVVIVQVRPGPASVAITGPGIGSVDIDDVDHTAAARLMDMLGHPELAGWIRKAAAIVEAA